MEKTSVKEFVDQVKSEASKVTWPEKGDVMRHSLVVIIMIFICATFFLVADVSIFWIVQKLLSI